MSAQTALERLQEVRAVRPAVDLDGYQTSALFPRGVTSHFVDVDGYRTHYLEAGDAAADTVVLVHGAACSIGLGIERWYTVVGALAERFHVLAVDELGQGRTDPPRDVRQLGHTRVRADHVVAFIKTLGLQSIHLVGQSQGCWIAAYAALTNPELIDKLILIDSASTSGVETTKAAEKTELLPYSQNIFQPGSRIPKMDLKSRAGIRQMVGEFCYDANSLTETFIDHASQLAAVWADLYAAHDRMTWSGGLAEGSRWRQEQYSYSGRHISHAIESIATPTLVIWGRNSNKGLDAGFEMYKKLPNAQMHIVDHANHFVWIDRPQTFNSLVAWYLSQSE
jgi:pimeloyl-ACP methyl ester carboxylesterase